MSVAEEKKGMSDTDHGKIAQQLTGNQGQGRDRH
jgi:hypothetical protein